MCHVVSLLILVLVSLLEESAGTDLIAALSTYTICVIGIYFFNVN